MRRVRAIDPANNSMEVEAGCVLAAVQPGVVSIDHWIARRYGAAH